MVMASYIDHTLLKPGATVDDIMQLCSEAVEHRFAAVCVNPCYVGLAAHLLAGTGVKTATVVGFPLGANLTETKVAETAALIKAKADEIDMVINIGAVKAGQWAVVTDEIRQVVNAAAGNIVKVIIETALLTGDQKRAACECIMAAGAHFVKTSTGFGPGGATEADVILLKSIVGSQIGIKAAGGIRTRQQAEKMIAAGATRLGTSAGVAIVTK